MFSVAGGSLAVTDGTFAVDCPDPAAVALCAAALAAEDSAPDGFEPQAANRSAPTKNGIKILVSPLRLKLLNIFMINSFR
jgi:hypothetical protein